MLKNLFSLKRVIDMGDSGGVPYNVGSGGGGGGDEETVTQNVSKLENIARKQIEHPEVPKRRRVFTSYRFRDKAQVELLRGQVKNKNSDLDFIDMGLKVPFDSDNADYIRSGIRERIRQSSVTLVFVSETTHESKWINWEIQESIDQGKGIVVVRKDPSDKLPDALSNGNKVKVVGWNHEEIMNGINEVAE
jgi:hypothetical protein